MRYVFLPPYSPDFNPIELAFSAIKSHIRRYGDLYRAGAASDCDKGEVLTQLHSAVWSVTANDAAGWFRHCGYM